MGTKHVGGTKQDRINLFALAYVANGGNGADAARKAGYSPKGSDVAAVRLLRDARCIAAIEVEQQKLREKYRLTTANMLRSLEQAMFFDPRKLFHADGTIKSIHELDEDTAMALQAIESEVVINKRTGKATFHLKKVKWLDRNTARDQANKILGAYKAEAPPPGGDPVANALDRLAERSSPVLAKFAAVTAALQGTQK